VPILESRARECDHRDGPRAPALVEAVVRDGRLRRAVRRYGQPLRAVRQRRRGARVRAGAEARRGTERGPRAARRDALAGRESPRDPVREAVQESMPASHPAHCARRESSLEIQFEKLYRKLFLPHARHSARGASKRYAGMLYPSGDVEFVGMEVVRRDWTPLARDVQRELYRRLFTGEPVDAYLKDVVACVRSGALDDALVYRKQLRKRADEYTRTTPPHVAAARKSGASKRGALISYVMTTAGAEPVDEVRHPVDREHYVQKQVRPVAEPVLEVLGLDFERAIGDARQLDLLS